MDAVGPNPLDAPTGRTSMTDDFTILCDYIRNPEPYEAEVAANRALCHNEIDRGMAALNQKQALWWAQENEHADRT